MIPNRTLLVALLVAGAPTSLRAQFPGGVPMGGAMGGRMGGMGRPDNPAPPMESKPRVAKSDELVSLSSLLRGIKLTPDQQEAVRALEDKFNPLLLPALDVVRTELEAGKNGDQERLQKYQQRANRYREQEVAELKTLLDPAQLPRLERNVSDQRARTGLLIGRQ